MTDLVPAEQIEQIVGARRHALAHLGRAVSAEQTVYILHSQECRDSGIDLRSCGYSLALDNGIDLHDWRDHQDRAVTLQHQHGYLMPDDDGPGDIEYVRSSPERTSVIPPGPSPENDPPLLNESAQDRHRVTKTREALYSPPRTLRKRRKCSGHLAEPHWINAGQQAVWSSLPPHSEIGNEGWWHAVFCMDCAPAECITPPGQGYARG